MILTTYIKIIEICEILIMHNYQKWKERLAHERINANCTTERLFIYGAVTRVTYLPGLGGGAIEHVERTLNQLNGYHEDILEVLKNAASRRDLVGTPSGSNLLDEDALRKSLAECGYPDVYRKDTDGQDNGIDNGQEEEEDDVELQPPCGTIRIRNLEDLIRQLEHRASARPYMTGQMSPSGSEEIRTSETEPDRHYRIDSSVCSESSQGSRRCSRGRDEDASRFVYGRYRQPTSRSPYGNHQHTHQHSHQMHPEDEGIYETADPDRGSNTRGETPDCESSTTSSPVD